MIRVLIILLFVSLNLTGQDTFYYELDLTKNNDAFNVTLVPPQLSYTDNIYSFVAYARGVQQALDFGRFVKMFKVYDRQGNELITQKISTNKFKILEPVKVAKIVFEIDDSFDMEPGFRPIYPMNGTGITDNYTIINTYGVFGYFENLKENPIQLKIKLDGEPKIGTALNQNSSGAFESDSYYHFTDSPILIGDQLTYASKIIDGVKIEFYTYSPNSTFSAFNILDEVEPILKAAMFYIDYAPADRYTFLMFFADDRDIMEMPVFSYRGAAEYPLSSTFMLPADKKYKQFLKNTIANDFMHVLCPRSLHSNLYETFDFSNPDTEDMHLWLYKGVAIWSSYAMQVNGGIITFDEYLDFLSSTATRSQTFDTAFNLSRISTEWPTKEGLIQYPNIYQLGPHTAAMLDFKLLELSDGEKGLKRIYFELLEKYGEDKPFDNETFFDTLVAMTYPEIGEFIENHIQRSLPFDYNKSLRSFGVNYYKKRKNVDDMPTMGYTIKFSGRGRAYVSIVSDDYMGTSIAEGDTVTHINDIELKRSTSGKIMADLKVLNVGEEYEISIKRGYENMEFTEKMYALYEQNVFEADQHLSRKQSFMRDMIFIQTMAPDSSDYELLKKRVD